MGQLIVTAFVIVFALLAHGLIALVVGGLAYEIVETGPSMKTPISRAIFGLLFCGLVPMLTQFGLNDLVQFPLLISLLALTLYTYALLKKSEKHDA